MNFIPFIIMFLVFGFGMVVGGISEESNYKNPGAGIAAGALIFFTSFLILVGIALAKIF